MSDTTPAFLALSSTSVHLYDLDGLTSLKKVRRFSWGPGAGNTRKRTATGTGRLSVEIHRLCGS